MTFNGVLAVTLRYFTEFGKHALQQVPCRSDGAEFVHESIVFRNTYMSS